MARLYSALIDRMVWSWRSHWPLAQDFTASSSDLRSSSRNILIAFARFSISSLAPTAVDERGFEAISSRNLYAVMRLWTLRSSSSWARLVARIAASTLSADFVILSKAAAIASIPFTVDAKLTAPSSILLISAAIFLTASNTPWSPD